jgi:two-component system nitrate/nitrite response regulator NarL
MITIAIACKYQDDRAVITALLKEQEDFRVISIGSDGYDALKSATTQRPDIIIMDFSMKYIDSLELAPIIRRKSPSTALIVLCSPDEKNAAAKSLREGISGCLLRQDGFNNLVPSIRSVVYGGWYVSESVRDLALNYFPPPVEVFPVEMDISPFSFTLTETGIFYGIIRGHTDREIARNLNINIGSVRNCISRMKKKTGLRNRAQIIIHAMLAGILHIGNGYRHINN